MFRPLRSLILPCLLLAACSKQEVSDTLHMGRDAPDEFVVVSRPPLSVPPEFELRPPQPGATGPAQTSTEAQARQQLLGTTAPAAALDAAAVPASDTAITPVLTSEPPDAATSSFLNKFGTAKADDSIRDKLAADSAVSHAAKTQTLYEEVIGAEPAEPTVDPKAESERLRTNKDEGKPVNEGEVPTTTEKPKSVIDQIF